MQQKNMFTLEEIRSLLYYQGAVENIVLKPNETYLKEFYAVPNAYEGINMLLFDDVDSEKVRLHAEGRLVDSVILDHMPELLNVYCNLYTAICKYTYQNDERIELQTYRDDRSYTYLHMKEHKKNESFISTTLNSKKEGNGFQDKEGLTFFEFEVGTNAEYLEVNKVLGELSGYPDEEEVLLAPSLNVSMKKVEMTEAESTLTGLNNTAPIGKYHVILGNSQIIPQYMTEELEQELARLRTAILDSTAIENAKAVWREAEKGEIDSVKEQLYIEWKKKLHMYISKCYAVIKWLVLNDTSRKKNFEKDVAAKVNLANDKRKTYEGQLALFYGIEVVTGVLTGLFLSFSMINLHPEIFKVLSLCMLAVFSIVMGWCKITSISEKLIQRTEIFFKYDELLEKWNYEQLQDSETLNLYIDKMLEISLLDNQHCKEYTNNKVRGMMNWEKEVSKMKDK